MHPYCQVLQRNSSGSVHRILPCGSDGDGNDAPHIGQVLSVVQLILILVPLSDTEALDPIRPTRLPLQVKRGAFGHGTDGAKREIRVVTGVVQVLRLESKFATDALELALVLRDALQRAPEVTCVDAVKPVLALVWQNG